MLHCHGSSSAYRLYSSRGNGSNDYCYPVVFAVRTPLFARKPSCYWYCVSPYSICGLSYYQVFKYKDGAFAQPARAVQSHLAPTSRNASSNQYQDAENANQIATMHSSSVIGYGYGKRFLHVVPIAGTSLMYAWWDLLLHNQILWAWMCVGSVGFFFFWIMIASILISACQTAQNLEAGAEGQASGMLSLATTVALLMFDLLDLQMSNYRDMLFAGCLAGFVNRRLYAPLLVDKKAVAA